MIPDRINPAPIHPSSPHITLRQTQEYSGHTGSVFAMALSEDEKWLFTSGDDGIVAQWDLHAVRDQGTAILRTDRSIYALLCLPDNRLMAGTSDGTLYLLDLNDHKIIHTLRKTTASIYNLHFDKVTGMIWCLHGLGRLTLFEAANLREIAYLQLSARHLRSVCESADGQNMFIGTSDNRILVLDRRQAGLLQEWEAHKNSVFSLAILPDTDYLLSGGMDAHLNIWDTKNSFKLVKSLPAHYFTVNDIVISPDGNYFATASRDKTFKLWNSLSFDLLKVVDYERNQAHRHSINRIKWLKADNNILSCSDDRRIIRWKVILN
ncbi:MAG: hypothetical protein SF052_26605 [Bacteroidia bacterium]|nr:hypothetical protein [Bacteroidia bacterium]